MMQHNPVLANLKPEALTSQLAIHGTTDVITSNRRIILAEASNDTAREFVQNGYCIVLNSQDEEDVNRAAQDIAKVAGDLSRKY